MLLQTNGDTNLQAQQVVVMLPATQIKARVVDTWHDFNWVSILSVNLLCFTRAIKI